MINFLRLNAKPILKTISTFCGAVFSALSFVLTCFSWDDIGIASKKTRFIIMVVICVVTSIMGLIYFGVFKRKSVIWENGSGKISVSYGDILTKAFPRKNKKNKIVVVSVNTSFDTIVDRDITGIDKPLVSPNSIHGQWVEKMVQNGCELSEIDADIANALQRNSIQPIRTLSKTEKPRGNRSVYPIGTIVPIKGDNNVIYFLLAISDFDENNTAQSSKDKILKATDALIDFYNRNGQGFDLFVTLLGTNLANSGLSHSQTLDLITSEMKIQNEKIRGKINIVIYNKDKDKVSIYN